MVWFGVKAKKPNRNRNRNGPVAKCDYLLAHFIDPVQQMRLLGMPKHVPVVSLLYHCCETQLAMHITRCITNYIPKQHIFKTKTLSYYYFSKKPYF